MKSLTERSGRLSKLWPAGLAVLMTCGEPAEKPRAPGPTAESNKVKITRFYASSGVVARGEEVTICYGVENAEEVRLDPPIREVRPTFNRCFSIAPDRTRIYRLTATGPGGEDSAEFAIQVVAPEAAPAASLIPLFLANQNEVAKGQPVTLCYSVEGAEAVRIDPPVRELEPTSRCFTVTPEATTRYTLKATGPGGRSESKSLVVTVR